MTLERPFGEIEESKVLSLEEVGIVVAKAKKLGRTTGLITGCFDVLHVSHVDLFRHAKQHVDILVVGVERDETLKSKGPDRPFNNLKWRCKLLSELMSVDLVSPLRHIIEYKPSINNDNLFIDLYKQIAPDFLITNPLTDDFWKEKKQRADSIGIGFLGLEVERKTSSTEIIRKIQKES